MRYDTIQTAVVNRIKAKLDLVFPPIPQPPAPDHLQYKVISQPESQSEFPISYHTPHIIVAVTGANHKSPDTTDIVAQEETVNFAIHIRGASLYGQAATANEPQIVGVHALVERVRRALLGFRPVDCDKMYLLNFEILQDLEHGVFAGVMNFSAVRWVVEEEEPANDPALQILDYLTPIGTITIQ